MPFPQLQKVLGEYIESSSVKFLCHACFLLSLLYLSDNQVNKYLLDAHEGPTGLKVPYLKHFLQIMGYGDLKIRNSHIFH